jgi:flavin-dependent dehydrogenase
VGGGAQRYEVIVVGGGPAGIGTALALAARDPALGAGTLVLEKARHPRDKTCAGGLIPRADAVLHALGVEPRVAAVRVDRALVAVPGRRVRIGGDALCRVVRRRDFDAALAGAARGREVAVQEGARVVSLARDAHGVRVETESATYRAPVVVGADGSGSLVRRRLIGGPSGPMARAVMCDVPVTGTRWNGHADHRYDFDFLVLAAGVRGYGWLFPALVDDVPHANVGVYGLPPYDAGTMQRELWRLLGSIGVSERPAWKAFPIHTYHPAARLAAPHALLVGDAAGVDPLMGEGISFALEYGVHAAEAILEARHTGEWSFAAYERAIHAGPLGRKLGRLVWAAERCYGPRWRWWLRAARSSRRLQQLALDWYNGTAPWAGRGHLALLRAFATAAPGRAAA